MKTQNNIKKLHSFQSANVPYDVIKEHFVVRQHEFHRVISEIQKDDMEGSIQHYIFIGRRGSGKSTLLRRIQAEVDEDKRLNKKLLVVNLGEEQAGVHRLYDLWDMIIRELKTIGLEFDEPDWTMFSDDLSEYTKTLYYSIHNTLKKEGKKLIILLDNIDRIFKNIGNDDHLLRELLMNYKDIRLVGGSTRMSEHYWQYENPFYEFFSFIRLEALDNEEVKGLLSHWSNYLNNDDLKKFIKNNPGQINAIRILTDGMPRTLLNFIEILIDRPEQNGFDYLHYIIDRATPLYQERLGNLTPAQQKIVLELSNFWDAVKVKPLIQACKMPGKVISAQLNRLEKIGVVEKVKGLKKDNLYRLSERFFNMWLLMTQGGPEAKYRVKYLTAFLENWYQKTELQKIFTQHIDALKAGSLKFDYAALMSKALVHSKYLNIEQRDELITSMNQLKDTDQNYLKFLPEISKEIFEKAIKQIEQKKFNESRQTLDKIEQECGEKFFIKGFSYSIEGDYTNGEKYCLKAIDKGVLKALYILAIIYENSDRIEEAEKYYLKAIENGILDALFNVAILYNESDRIEKAEKYYLEAIDNGHKDAINNLAIMYEKSGQAKKAEKYYLKAIEKGKTNAMINLANLYKKSKRTLESEKYFLKAIDSSEIDASNNLAILYKETGRIKEAEKYFLKAINNGHKIALYNLAILYSESDREKEAERYYLKAIDYGDVNAMFNLANLYEKSGQMEAAEKYYLIAIKNGHNTAMYNLCVLYYFNNFNKLKTLNLIAKYLQKNNEIKVQCFYSVILLWKGKMNEFENVTKNLIPLLIKENDYENLFVLFIEFLIHKQYHIIWKWFTNEYFSGELKNLIKPIYYVTSQLISNKVVNEEVLKAGEELQGTIIELIEYIKERQEFYYGKADIKTKKIN